MTRPISAADLPAERVKTYLAEETNRALRRGSLWLALLGFSSALELWVVLRLGWASNLEGPALVALVGGGYSSFVYLLARRGRIEGAWLWAVLLVFASYPTGLFLWTHWFMPAGAATYLTGPYSYLYCVIVAAIGLAFDFRLSFAAGLVAGAGYFGCYWLARPHLAAVAAPDPTLLQDLTAPAVWAFKSIMIAFSGLVSGAVSRVARRLVMRVLHEERDKLKLDGLLGQYVSPEVRDRIVRQKKALVGERRTVAVLFSDIRGFSAMSESRDPHDLVPQLNEYFDGMVSAVTAHGGVVDKFIGDTVMAVFGGLVELPSAPAAALGAARAMRRALTELNADWQASGWPPFETGIGLHYGEVLQGSIGSEDRKDFTVIGDAVNTASRLEGLTKEFPYPIVMTQAFRDALPAPADRAACVPLGRTRLKGKAQEVDIFGVSA